MLKKSHLFFLSTLLFCSPLLAAVFTKNTDNGWPTYGGDPGGQRYSTSTQITRANVGSLHPVWEYHTHALESGILAVSRSDFEATPILFRDTLYLSTPFDRVIALDPASGTQKWSFDPHLAPVLLAGNYTSRGVAAWEDAHPDHHNASCNARIFVATLDARLIALDAKSGSPCKDFGKQGQVDLKTGIIANPDQPYAYYGNTSPATVVGNVVVVGSAVADNTAVNVESGAVRGFDARTGAELWSWEPLPWAARQTLRTGAGNAWAVIAADPEHNLVFVPTGSASPDFYGASRPGDNRDANSVVALNAQTGKKVWAFQLVHHDVWDYDLAAEPLLFTYKGRTPAVAVAAKNGIVFILDRLTGKPLVPVEERPVPASSVPGEHLSPTQPFTMLLMNPLTMNPLALPGHSAEGLDECRAKLKDLRYQGVFTPVSLQGTLQYPGSLGGVNWGSMSFDPESGILYANVNGSAYETRLVRAPPAFFQLRPKPKFVLALVVLILLAGMMARRKLYPGSLAMIVAVSLVAAAFYLRAPATFTYKRQHNMVNSPDAIGELSPNRGTKYQIYRRVLQDSDSRPCTPQPWGATTALNLDSGQLAWRAPLGTLIAGEHTGTVSFGAPIVTAGGLLFTAASSNPLLRAIDKATGEEVWTGKLPVPAQSTPMTYTYRGKQYIVVAAGGHGGLGTPLGDSVIAYSL